jgi:GT2 family glycosyltransferase
MIHPRIAVIVPSYEAFPYARRTLLSLFKYTPDAIAIVVDDASPSWNKGKWLRGIKGEVRIHQFPKNGGLTRSWNRGMEMVRPMDVDYVVLGNNDILFNVGWWRGMAAVLEDEYGLAGPLSNAPGVTARGLQDITSYVTNYALTDKPKYNNKLAQLLWKTYQAKPVATPVNGFFMMAKPKTLFDNAFTGQFVFRPVNSKNSRGKSNPTPLMTGNEDELQKRLSARGVKSAVALGSFIFHYRSVARGQKFVKGQWLRMDGDGGDV